MNAIVGSPKSYDPVLRAVHWSTLALIAAMFATAWIAHSGLAGDYYRPTMQLHRSLGLSVLALTIFRLAWRRRARIPALPADLPAIQKLGARTTEAMLYALLLAQPVLGLLQTNARGQRVDFFFVGELPAVIDPDRALARQLHDLHAFVAWGLLGLIGLHAAAGLFHHFVRRDDVLNAMLPVRWRRTGRSVFALTPPTEQS
jgi:cytochrome b561